MSIMKCPKCNGSGKEYVDPGNSQSTSAAPYVTMCTSCGGKGYVTDKEE